ncbi:hypothetical protein NE848_12815 [Gramella jeungdoensis]|uniref:Uncharacterized protein n=1 Tax=Gramella jeungdoensis TaxID=708091 RepID=A0ABT0Z4D0_9FLAO|nr:hypothetical protein [Gramella jeungdoensis]MCM8570268.1 hypothetical protein [Gramella jeungdoensis]
MKWNDTVYLDFSRFLKVLKSIKEYYVLIASVPIVIGAIHQIYSLFSISPEYIRFFSPSQLLKDGLVYLSIFYYPIFIILLVYILMGLDSFKAIGLTLILLLNTFILWFIPDIFNLYVDTGDADFLYTVVCLTLFIIFGSLVGVVFIFKIKNTYITTPLIIIMSVLFLWLLHIAITNGGKEKGLYQDKRFGNKENVDCYIRQQSYYQEDYSIEYFNDEYIFLVFNGDSKEREVRVLKFDILLNDSLCNSD